MNITTPRIMISGVRDGVGTSLVSLGLAYELRRMGISSSFCVRGANFLDAILLKRISGRYVRTLDERLLSAGQMCESVAHACVGSDLLVVEGAGGLYDGYAAGTIRGSDAEVAALLKMPVVLVADSRGFGTSIVALLRGYFGFAQGFEIGGAILNYVEERPEGDPDIERRDREFYEATLQAFRVPKLVGALPQLPFNCPIPRGKVSQEKNLAVLPRQFLIDLGAAVARHIDINQIVTLAGEATQLNLENVQMAPSRRRARIAVSDDSCFNLCFQDNLDLLRYNGAELVPFSPVADSALPKRIGGVYLTGAYLAEYGRELAGNEEMKAALRSFIQSGGVLYAEGAGAAYLCEEFVAQPGGPVMAGVGAIPGRAIGTGVSQIEYGEAVAVEECIVGSPGAVLKGISTGEWRIEERERMLKVLRTRWGRRQAEPDGYSPGAQVLATLGFTHFGSSPALPKSIVEAAEVVFNLAT